MRTTSTHERALFRHRAFSRPAVRNQHTHHMQREHFNPDERVPPAGAPSRMKLAPVITSASTAATQPPSLRVSIASAGKAPAPGAYGAIRCSLLMVQMIHDSARWHVAVQLLDFGDEVTRRPSPITARRGDLTPPSRPCSPNTAHRAGDSHHTRPSITSAARPAESPHRRAGVHE